MFLIEYSEGRYINGDKVDWVQVNTAGEVSVTLAGDTEKVYKVDADYACIFVNNLQALSGIGGLESRYHETISNPQSAQT